MHHRFNLKKKALRAFYLRINDEDNIASTISVYFTNIPMPTIYYKHQDSSIAILSYACYNLSHNKQTLSVIKIYHI